MLNTLSDRAVFYAKQKWRVIALHWLKTVNHTTFCSCHRGIECTAPGKHPIFTKNWREIATADAKLIRLWWRKWPLANIGLLMGGQDNLVCLDIDGAQGKQSLSKLETDHSPLPLTLSQCTGRTDGGEHRLFKADMLYSDLIRNRIKIAPGLDFKAEGGYIVAAPSVHSSGQLYQWHDLAMPVADLPEWLLKIAAAGKREGYAISGERPDEAALEAEGFDIDYRIDLAAKALLLTEPAIQGQNGSRACLKAAILLIRGFCLPSDKALDLLEKVYNPLCVPPWSTNELMHKLESAEYSDIYPWRYKIPVCDTSTGGLIVEALFREGLNG